VGVDLHCGDDRPQIRRHRLMERQQRETPVVDLDVQRVQRLVAAQHALDERLIAIDEPFDRDAHVLLREPAHLEQTTFELVELFLEMPYDAIGLRHFPMLAGPHPRSLSLGGPASPGFPPAPRSGRRRFSYARGAPPPLALTRRPGFAGLPSGASLGPQALFLCSRGPTPARSHSAARLRRASLRRLARAAGAFPMLAGPTPARSHSAARLRRASLRRL